ncbi:unnamed protein product, partial [Ectocarpus fasciculatus]
IVCVYKHHLVCVSPSTSGKQTSVVLSSPLLLKYRPSSNIATTAVAAAGFPNHNVLILLIIRSVAASRQSPAIISLCSLPFHTLTATASAVSVVSSSRRVL